MRELSLDGPDGRLRARRWDVLVLGGAIPGLVGAVRLGMAGLRVLVVEEDAAARVPAMLRDPFFLAGGGSESVLQRCLTALGVPLIDRRSIEDAEIAFQLLLPNARVDIGLPARTQEELVAWGLAKPELARDVVSGLADAARAEAEELLRAPIVRRGARRAAPTPGPTPASRHLRGLPAVLRQADAPLRELLDAQVRALANVGIGEPSPEARARLLGSALAGGAVFPPDRELRTLLRKRIEQLHGEVRTLGAPFEFVQIDGHPGITMRRSRDAWIGRALVVNAPPGLVANALESWEFEVPEWLGRRTPQRRRAAIHLRAVRDVLPDALASRALIFPEGETDAIALSVHPSERKRYVDLAARQTVDVSADLAAAHDRIEASVRALLPFSEKKVARVADAGAPLWDDEFALGELDDGGWPTEVEIRANASPLVYHLPRDAMGAVGAEGDLLLGWHAGDTLAAALS
ncbi:MAG: hypothetical protein OEP95_02150 [Myxococcales bacterium]|nr:hypothetical protein [Myxococcales bacterium]